MIRKPEACVIRQATAEDAAAVEALYRELISDPLIHVSRSHVGKLFLSDTSFLLVAELDGIVRGTALLNLCQDAMYRAQPFGVVENVVVSEKARGHGIGRQLLTHVEHLAITRDCTKLMLLSSATRTSAHAFFRRCGFTGDTKLGFVKYRSRFGIR
ncbi:GNAT family N-acetyltransferase [Luteolibacter yonseiensis]|uniref:GNAT family N-acetyltransferase n=1 Tax=Luteolibacter yonseiensis TaxID=1144680 RepID=A0A934R5K6_9BACT|nr:GNAT family N-acetyltransferase [Luteolibacter yonseiensis]MBK1815665.1 GNAT family N-acetyltransferase [Luteolibacter yonseiensis]